MTDTTQNPMPFEVIADSDSSRDEWLEARKSIITASDVGAVLDIPRGAGKGSGLPRLWLQKKGWVIPSGEQHEAAEFGHVSEHFHARDLYAPKTGRRVTRAQKLLRSTQYPWLGATLDYWITDTPENYDVPVPLELKSTGNKDNWPEDEEPHLRWQAQLQTQMLVTGAEWGAISAIIGSPWLHHRFRDYNAHAAFQQLIVNKTRAFMDSLALDECPFDDSEDCAYAHRAMAILSGDTVELPPEAAQWDARLEELKNAKRDLETELRELQNRITASIGVAEAGVIPGTDVTYTFKTQKRKGYTVQPSETRVLRRKEANPT